MHTEFPQFGVAIIDKSRIGSKSAELKPITIKCAAMAQDPRISYFSYTYSRTEEIQQYKIEKQLLGKAAKPQRPESYQKAAVDFRISPTGDSQCRVSLQCVSGLTVQLVCNNEPITFYDHNDKQFSGIKVAMTFIIPTNDGRLLTSDLMVDTVEMIPKQIRIRGADQNGLPLDSDAGKMAIHWYHKCVLEATQLFSMGFDLAHKQECP